MSKTVTEYFRQPCFDDAVIYDDRTETVTVHRVHADCEEIEMRELTMQDRYDAVVEAACG